MQSTAKAATAPGAHAHRPVVSSCPHSRLCDHQHRHAHGRQSYGTWQRKSSCSMACARPDVHVADKAAQSALRLCPPAFPLPMTLASKHLSHSSRRSACARYHGCRRWRPGEGVHHHTASSTRWPGLPSQPGHYANTGVLPSGLPQLHSVLLSQCR